MFATAIIFVIFYEISFVVEFGKILSLGSGKTGYVWGT